MRTIRNRCILLIGVLSILISSTNARAQDFTFAFTSEGGNFWTNIAQFPAQLLNAAVLAVADEFMDIGDSGTSIGTSKYEWLIFTDGGRKMDVDLGRYFGLTARDIFNYFGYGVTFGYQPRYSIFGILFNGGYRFRQFGMSLDNNAEKDRYLRNSYYVGATIRLSPLAVYKDWSPVIEIGTNYNKVFACTAPFDSDKDQFGKGFISNYAIGYRDEHRSYVFTFDMSHFNYFNPDFVAKDGSKPYANIFGKSYAIGVRYQIDF